MNYILHLAGFFDRVSKDDRLGPLHISMYVSLFQFWNASRFKNPISISRNELMRVSKICSKATYHKCIRELNDYGYLHYQPSFNPIRGSLVYLFNFEAGDEQHNESKRTKIKTASRQVEEPYINNTNIINSKHAKEQAHADTSSNFDQPKSQETEPDNSTPGGRPLSKNRRTRKDPIRTTNNQQRLPSAASAKDGTTNQSLPLPTSVNEVQTFFENEKSTKHEAEKFYNYFQSNGWKVGGRAPMRDWNAAARNWILNSDKFGTKKKTLTLHASTVKDYGEPL